MTNEIIEKAELTQEIKQHLLRTWKVFSSSPLTYFHTLWPALLTNGIGIAFFAVVLINFSSNYLVPLYVLKGQTNLPIRDLIFIISPGWTDCVILLLSIIALLIGQIVYHGITLLFSETVIKEGKAPKIYLYNNKLMWAYIKLSAANLFSQLLVLLVFTIISVLLIIYLSQWFIILFSFMLVYWIMAYEQGSIEHVLNKRNLRKITIHNLILLGVSKKSFAAQIISWTILAPYTLISLLPVIIISCTYYYDCLGILTGDTSGLPPYMTLLTFFVFVLTVFFLQSFYSLKKVFLSKTLIKEL